MNLIKTGRFLSFIAGAALLCCAVQCTISNVAGTGSQAGNGIVTATVITPDGQPAANASVFLRPKTFLKDTTAISETRIPDATTAKNGVFAIDSVDPGEYLVEVNDEIQNALLLVCVKDSGKTANLGTLMLKPQAGFYGLVVRENIPATTRVFVQAYGFDHIREVNVYGEFSFFKIPAGNYDLRIFSSDTSLGVVDSEIITVNPAEELDAGLFLLPFEYWRDTLVVRELLDSNGLIDTPVTSVTVVKNGRVGELDLTHRAISVIPKSIGNLRLTHLIVNENFISSLPVEIGKIASLEYLSATMNRLFELPHEIGNCKRLKHLEVSNNRYFNRIPFEIGELTSLTYLGFQRNDITILPGSIGNLTALKTLDLGYNRIERLPFEIITLHELDFLSINYNRLRHNPPEIEQWIDAYSFDPEWRKTQGMHGK